MWDHQWYAVTIVSICMSTGCWITLPVTAGQCDGRASWVETTVCVCESWGHNYGCHRFPELVTMVIPTVLVSNSQYNDMTMTGRNNWKQDERRKRNLILKVACFIVLTISMYLSAMLNHWCCNVIHSYADSRHKIWPVSAMDGWHMCQQIGEMYEYLSWSQAQASITKSNQLLQAQPHMELASE